MWGVCARVRVHVRPAQWNTISASQLVLTTDSITNKPEHTSSNIRLASMCLGDLPASAEVNRVIASQTMHVVSIALMVLWIDSHCVARMSVSVVYACNRSRGGNN